MKSVLPTQLWVIMVRSPGLLHPSQLKIQTLPISHHCSAEVLSRATPATPAQVFAHLHALLRHPVSETWAGSLLRVLTSPLLKWIKWQEIFSFTHLSVYIVGGEEALCGQVSHVCEHPELESSKERPWLKSSILPPLLIPIILFHLWSEAFIQLGTL